MDIRDEYRRDVREVYENLAKALDELHGTGALEAYKADCQRVLAEANSGGLVELDDDGNPVLPTSPEASLRAKAAQLIGAASKRALRRYVVEGLDVAKRAGQDVTPAIAQHVCHKIVGRGVKREFLNAHFGTPGRTAADKSTVTLDQLKEMLDWLEDGLDELKSNLKAIRNAAKARVG